MATNDAGHQFEVLEQVLNILPENSPIYPTSSDFAVGNFVPA